VTSGAHFEWVEDRIVRETKYVPGEETSRATVFALANGYMGLRGAPEEVPASRPGEKGCYVGGVYDTPSGKLTEREIVAFPDWTAMRLAVDGEPFDPSTGEVLEWMREIDLGEAVVRRRVRWRSPRGKVLTYASERLVSFVRPHIGALRCSLTAEDDCAVELLAGTDACVYSRWADHYRHVAPDGEEAGILWIECDTFEPGYRLTVGTRFAWTEAPRNAQSLRLTEGRAVWEAHRFRLAAGESCAFERIAAILDSRFAKGDLRSSARRELADAAEYDAARTEHVAAWKAVLERSDVAIEGDPAAQMGIRFAVAHLLMAAPWHRCDVSVPARGLQGQDYYGSIFWDCELFVLPFLAATQPEAARRALGYRIATLDGARRKAARFGYRGAFYAWQSQETGDDQCDLYVFNDPRDGKPIRSYFCDEQIHISADIAYAFRQYASATGDEAIWREGGAEVCAEIARLFVSRAEWEPEEGLYRLRKVLGPDEYHERVDDNAFTNWMAAEAANIAYEALGHLFDHHRANYEALTARLGLTDEEVDGFAGFARRIFRPSPAPDTKLIEQFAGYFRLTDEPVEATRARLAHPDLHKGGPLGPFQETQNIKQADVVMLLYLLRDRFPREVKEANWRYYEPRTAHDSSLSPMAYALVAAGIGRIDWAYRYFIQTSHIDLASYGPHWNLGIHAAALGGAWLAIAHGFCRLRLAPEAVVFDAWPEVPANWTRVRVPFQWHGAPLAATVEPGRLRLESFGSRTVPVLTPDGASEIGPGGALEWPLGTDR
jgi:kojibiose phosphorylase